MRRSRLWRPLTHAAAAWVLIAGAALLAARGGAFAAHLLGAGAAAVALAAAGWLAPRRLVRVDRRIPPGPHAAGSALEVQILVDVQRRWPGLLTVHDMLPPGLGGDAPTFVLFPWRRGLHVFRYALADLPRGIWPLTAMAVGRGDLFGFWRITQVVPVADVLEVWPPTVALPEPSALPADFGSAWGRIRQAFTEGEDLRGVRPWAPGDRPSRIHWRTTAHTGAWFVKLLEPSSLAALTVAVDEPATFTRESFELALAAAASLVRFAAERALPVGLVLRGTGAQFPPEPGRSHADRLMRALAEARWDPAAVEASGRPLFAGGPTILLTGADAGRRGGRPGGVRILPVGPDQPGGLTRLDDLPAWFSSGRLFA